MLQELARQLASEEEAKLGMEESYASLQVAMRTECVGCTPSIHVAFQSRVAFISVQMPAMSLAGRARSASCKSTCEMK